MVCVKGCEKKRRFFMRGKNKVFYLGGVMSKVAAGYILVRRCEGVALRAWRNVFLKKKPDAWDFRASGFD